MRKIAVSTLALAMATTVALAGCGSSGKDKPSPSTAVTKPGSAVPGPTLVQNSVPATVPNDPEVRKTNAVAITSCAAVAGGWAAKGTAKNTTSGKLTYKITIFFTASAGGTVQDFADTTVSVNPGATENWEAAKQFGAQAGTKCVLRGLATQ